MATFFHKAFLSKRNVLIALGVLVLIFAVCSLSGKTSGMLSTTKILFVGDLMFDRTIRTIAEKGGYDQIFSCVSDYVKDFDTVVGNLEGPITKYPSRSAGTIPGEEGNTSFTFDAQVAHALAKFNFKVLSLANNHILDFGKEGLSMTKDSLTEAGISYFGAPSGDISIVKELGGKKIAFVAFNQFAGQNDPQKTIDAIRDTQGSTDFVVVYAHWGEEYTEPTEYVKSLAHRFIDSGADFIVGSHPHIIQDHEIYKGKHIYYSLGNFIFDQYWNTEVRTGLGLELSLRGDDVLVIEQTFDIQRSGKTCLVSVK